MEVEVYWVDLESHKIKRLSLEIKPKLLGKVSVTEVLDQMPEMLALGIRQKKLKLACFGRTLHLNDVLAHGDRIEVLGPILVDVRAERAARVKMVRDQQRGPYNRSYSAKSQKT